MAHACWSFYALVLIADFSVVAVAEQVECAPGDHSESCRVQMTENNDDVNLAQLRVAGANNDLRKKLAAGLTSDHSDSDSYLHGDEEGEAEVPCPSGPDPEKVFADGKGNCAKIYGERGVTRQIGNGFYATDCKNLHFLIDNLVLGADYAPKTVAINVNCAARECTTSIESFNPSAWLNAKQGRIVTYSNCLKDPLGGGAFKLTCDGSREEYKKACDTQTLIDRTKQEAIAMADAKAAADAAAEEQAVAAAEAEAEAAAKVAAAAAKAEAEAKAKEAAAKAEAEAKAAAEAAAEKALAEAKAAAAKADADAKAEAEAKVKAAAAKAKAAAEAAAKAIADAQAAAEAEARAIIAKQEAEAAAKKRMEEQAVAKRDLANNQYLGRHCASQTWLYQHSTPPRRIPGVWHIRDCHAPCFFLITCSSCGVDPNSGSPYGKCVYKDPKTGRIF